MICELIPDISCQTHFEKILHVLTRLRYKLMRYGRNYPENEHLVCDDSGLRVSSFLDLQIEYPVCRYCIFQENSALSKQFLEFCTPLLCL